MATQQAESETTRGKWSSIPIAAPFYTPDTSWGAGAFLLAYRDVIFDTDEKTDQLGIFGTYTLKDQKSIGFTHDIFINRYYRVEGKFAYQNSSSDFWGTGVNSGENDIEKYTAEELLADVTLFRAINNNLFAGPQARFRYADIHETEAEGILEKSELTGKTGGSEAGFGLRLIYDSTDSPFYPTRGILVEGSTLFCSSALAGSDFDYIKTRTDIRYYIGITGNHVLAFQSVAELCSDNVPFLSMSTIGGSMIMRGFPQNRFTDINSMAFQGEYRFPIISRFAGAVFASAGTVSGSIDNLFDISDYLYAGGGGLRFILDMEKRIAIRLDLGVSEEGANAYFLFREAF